MHTIHVRWQYQCTICLRHFYVLHQFGVFKYKLITRRNNITYSFNMRWMFIIVHGHISQHALQLHFSQRKKKNQHLLHLLHYFGGIVLPQTWIHFVIVCPISN